MTEVQSKLPFPGQHKYPDRVLQALFSRINTELRMRVHKMTDFHNDQWKGWLDDFDMDDPSRATPLQGNSGTATNEFTWDGAPVGQELSWGRTLSEDAANSSDFLKRLAAQVEGNKRA